MANLGHPSSLPQASLGLGHQSTSPASHFNVLVLVYIIYLKIVPKTKMVEGQLSLVYFTVFYNLGV